MEKTGNAPATRCLQGNAPSLWLPQKRPIRKSNPSHTGDNRAATPVASWAVMKNDDDRRKGTVESNHEHQDSETCVLPIELVPQMGALERTP